MSNHRALNMFGRSGNPAFGNKFSQQGSFVGTDAMSLSGTVNKTGIALILTIISAGYAWGNPVMHGWVMPAVLVGFGFAIFILILND